MLCGRDLFRNSFSLPRGRVRVPRTVRKGCCVHNPLENTMDLNRCLRVMTQCETDAGRLRFESPSSGSRKIRGGDVVWDGGTDGNGAESDRRCEGVRKSANPVANRAWGRQNLRGLTSNRAESGACRVGGVWATCAARRNARQSEAGLPASGWVGGGISKARRREMLGEVDVFDVSMQSRVGVMTGGCRGVSTS